MSSQEVNSSASTPQNSIITSTTEEDDSQNNNNNNNDHVDEEAESRPDEGTVEICSTSTTQQEAENSSSSTADNNQIKTVITAAAPAAVTAGPAESDDVQVVRSESVIKSPSKPLFVSSSTTPVIKVVDSSSSSSTSSTSTTSLSQGPPSSEANAADYSSSSSGSSSGNHQAGETKRVSAIGTSVIAQAGVSHSSSSSSASPSQQQQQNSTSFLHSVSSPTPSNPFLRTSSFSSGITSSTQESSSDLSSADIFAPPKLLAPFSSASGNLFSDASANFLRPSVLRSADSNTEGNLFSETISSSKTFISLNKEDIGTIKTPAFVKNTLDNEASSFSNGSSSILNKETEDTTVTTNDEKPLFTFGQNLSARVVFDSGTSSTASKAAELKTASEINSTSDNLFSFSDNYDKLKDASVDSNQPEDLGKSENDAENKNGESSDGVFKRKYEVITGEEDEQNVLSIHGKLYAWDTDSANWTEKGRGFLRLNDVRKNDKLCSRLVMRTTGALRVILNAHLVAGMKFEPANDNCLRFTNVDGIYMIKANPKDIEHLNQAIEHRLREMSKRMKTEHEVQPTDSNDDHQQQQQESKEESAFDSI